MRTCAVALIVAAMSSVAAADITFTPEYADPPGTGFLDPTLGPARRAAFEFALNRWGSILKKSYDGETVNVAAVFYDQGSATQLGGALSLGYFNNFGAGVADTLYGSALANHVKKADLDTAEGEIVAGFNTAFPDFYFGTDGNTPANKIDFVTLVMHEICHGLGFDTAIAKADGKFKRTASGPAGPLIFDRFLIDNTDTYLTAMTDAGRAAATTSGGLFFHGPSSGAGNGGNDFIQLYAPSTFEVGSSVGHLDPTAFPKYLMDPGQGRGKSFNTFAEPEANTRAILKDIGWDLAVPAPGSLFVLGAPALAFRRRR